MSEGAIFYFEFISSKYSTHNLSFGSLSIISLQLTPEKKWRDSVMQIKWVLKTFSWNEIIKTSKFRQYEGEWEIRLQIENFFM